MKKSVKNTNIALLFIVAVWCAVFASTVIAQSLKTAAQNNIAAGDKLGAVHAAALRFNNRKNISPLVINNDKSATPTKFVEAGGIRYAYRISGKGKPLLLIHRFRGTMEDWDADFLNALSKNRQVIIFDNAGIGQSSGSVPPTISEMAKNVASFVRALRIEQTDVLGWSMGGMEAQALALDSPDLVRRLILAGTAPGGSPETIPSQEAFVKVAAKPILTDDDYVFLFYTDSEESRRAGQLSQKRIGAAKQSMEKLGEKNTLVVSEKNWQSQGQAIGEWFGGKENYFSRLKSVRQPTLVANGDRDLAFPVFDSVLLAREIPGARLLIFPDAGHGFLFQYSNDFAAHVSKFLDAPAPK